MTWSWTRGGVALLAATLVLSACESTSPSRFDGPRVSILLTDAPGDITAAVIVIDEVALVGSNDGIHVLMAGSWQGDLLELRNTFATLVEEQEVPVGHYNQVRLRIPQGCLVTADGVFATPGFDACGTPTGTLQMPSFAQTGLKVLLPPEAEVQTEGRTIILLDFDVAGSFGRQAGQSGMWVMHPVVKATNFELSSNVLVTVELDDDVELPADVTFEDFSVSLEGAPGLALEEAGTLVLRFLVPGTRSIEILAPEGFVITTDPAVPFEFELASDTDLTLEFTITSIEAAEEEE